MDEQFHVSGNLALPRTHWTAGVSCGFSIYTALGFLVRMVELIFLFFPTLSVYRLLTVSPVVGFLYLPGDLLSFLLMPLHPFLPLLAQTFLEPILYYLIPFIFAYIALRISGKPAWRKGRRLAKISVILSGIVFVLDGAYLIFIFLIAQLSFHLYF